MANRGLFHRIRRVALRNAPAKAVSMAMAVAVFFFVRTTSLVERFVTVPLESRLPPRTVVTAGLPASVTVKLRGQRDTIFQLSPDDIVVYVDLSSNRNEGDYRVPVLYDKKGEMTVVQPLEITLDPSEVTATLEQVVTRSIRVRPAVIGEPPEGYVLESLETVPASVQVTGARRRVQGLTSLSTLPVDLGDTRESTVLAVRLDYDARVFTLPGGSTVQVAVTIAAVVPETEDPAAAEPEQPVQAERPET